MNCMILSGISIISSTPYGVEEQYVLHYGDHIVNNRRKSFHCCGEQYVLHNLS